MIGSWGTIFALITIQDSILTAQVLDVVGSVYFGYECYEIGFLGSQQESNLIQVEVSFDSDSLTIEMTEPYTNLKVDDEYLFASYAGTNPC